MERLQVCMAREGFLVDIERDDMGGIGIRSNTPPDQDEHYDAAFETCNHEVFPSLVEGHVEAPESMEYLRALYDYRLILVDCLADLGIETGEVPSFDVFKDQSVRWSPYTGIEPGVQVAQSEWLSVNQKCPQSPAFAPSDF